MERVRVWVLWAGVALIAACVLVVAAASAAGVDWIDPHSLVLLPRVYWVPTALGLALVRLLPPRHGRTALDDRVALALGGRPIGRELTRLLLCLLAFLLSAVLLAWLFEALGGALHVLGTPVARVVFLGLLPVLLVDRAGQPRVGRVSQLQALAVRVGEPWRWWGAVPVAVVLAVVLYYRWEALAGAGAGGLLLGALVVLLLVALPEEVFFRFLLQTRLEAVLGRGAGIVLVALLFAVAYAALGGYADFFRFDTHAVAGDYAVAVAGYGVVGLLYGYLWTRYRNLWLNVALRTGALTLIVGPAITM
ncbi:CPBP family intramembrane metalloprotease [Thermobifida alba]|uniref:CPBP family intramembrane metalloprotease n=1 Tax=Thermobifida alba TaxID=53522 RepID=A0ABY4L5T2_THEAE|nr:CPBP family intramembrane glutamic endopeptidase [Thermobifida alba]UPT22829.1 CPBP family intramembrane metalloprotease [Thermobifida alba]HLU98643.1 CPBP family intramembrane glutamic endopeptidase [Thermobifida alba]